MAIYSDWGLNLNTKEVWQEYPRMQLQRDSYMSLNGIWEYQITAGRTLPAQDAWKEIVVPFALGSKLS